MKWIGEMKTDLKLTKVTQENIQNREIFRSKMYKWQVHQEEIPKKWTETIWSEKRKEAHSKRMKLRRKGTKEGKQMHPSSLPSLKRAYS